MSYSVTNTNNISTCFTWQYIYLISQFSQVRHQQIYCIRQYLAVGLFQACSFVQLYSIYVYSIYVIFSVRPALELEKANVDLL